MAAVKLGEFTSEGKCCHKRCFVHPHVSDFCDGYNGTQEVLIPRRPSPEKGGVLLALRRRRKALRSADFFCKIEQMARGCYLGEFELMVLLALMRLGDEAYGVPISREIEQRSGLEVALGSVYAALERLEEKGLVASRLGDPTAERGGRAKRYFRVTESGLRDVRQTQRALVGLWKGLRELEGGMA
jgi:PadR family transcriptional regulator, regulatory protein PadR